MISSSLWLRFHDYMVTWNSFAYITWIEEWRLKRISHGDLIQLWSENS